MDRMGARGSNATPRPAHPSLLRLCCLPRCPARLPFSPSPLLSSRPSFIMGLCGSSENLSPEEQQRRKVEKDRSKALESTLTQDHSADQAINKACSQPDSHGHPDEGTQLPK